MSSSITAHSVDGSMETPRPRKSDIGIGGQAKIPRIVPRQSGLKRKLRVFQLGRSQSLIRIKRGIAFKKG